MSDTTRRASPLHWLDYYDAFRKVCLGFVVLGLLISAISMLVVGLRAGLIIMGIAWVGLLTFYLSFAFETTGKARLCCAGWILWALGMMANSLNLAFLTDISPNLSIPIQVSGLALMLIGGPIALVNLPAFAQYQKQKYQRSQQQQLLDSAKADPFYGEQLKRDKVKEQR